MPSKILHSHLQNEFRVKNKLNQPAIPTWLVSPRGGDVITASLWRFSEVSGSLLHAVVIYTIHRLFEQHFYRIISELFSSGSVLCVCLLTLIFQRVL